MKQGDDFSPLLSTLI